MKKFYLALFTLLLLLPISRSAASEGIQISPLTYKYEISEGANEQGKVIIKNLNSENLNYIIEKENFSYVTDDGAPSFSAPKDASNVGLTTLADWITITSPTEGMLAPSEEREITFTVSIPENAEPGGHYAAVFAKTVKKTTEGKTELGVSSRVGTLVLVSVPGETIKTNGITEFTSPSFIWRGPVDFTMKVENTGTIHYESIGSVDIKPMIGSTKKVDMGTHIIIPKNVRNYIGSWSSKYPIGYYKITASATDGSGNIVTKTATLWAIPIVIVGPSLLGLLILFLLIRFFKTHYKLTEKKNKSKK